MAGYLSRPQSLVPLRYLYLGKTSLQCEGKQSHGLGYSRVSGIKSRFMHMGFVPRNGGGGGGHCY